MKHQSGANASRRAFVGRGTEIAAVDDALDDAFAGRGTLFLIGGEPGIGKSRLCEELGIRSAARGARVLWGRCWEERGAPAFWPWIQPLRTLLEGDPATVRQHLGNWACELVRITPEVRELVPSAADPPPSDPDEARFRLFDAVASFLGSTSRAQPLLLVLDDLHAADLPSLLLLRFLAAQLARRRIVLLGTYRDAEIRGDHLLAPILGELAREPVTRDLVLRGLAMSDVALFVEQTLGSKPPDAIVATVCRETDGNPLFVGEMVRMLEREGTWTAAASSGRLPVSLGVRQVIARRLARLSEPCRQVLIQSAVLGREFSLEVLALLCGRPREEVLTILDEAREAGLVVEAPGSRARLRFSHALVRDAVYDDIPASGRVRFHHRAVEVLELLAADRPEPYLAQLAHHAYESASVGDPHQAISYACRAGEHALAMLAYEEAARLFEMGLDALEGWSPGEDGLRCEVLLGLGDARMRAGDAAAAKEAFRHAGEAARRSGAGDHLARAALGYGGRFAWAAARGDRVLVDLLEEAAHLLADRSEGLRVRVLARLAAALRDAAGTRARRESLSEEAIELARRCGDTAALAYALEVRTLVIWGPDSSQERLELATEMLGLADRAGDRERQLQAHHWALMTSWEMGQRERLQLEIAAQARVADQLRQPAQQWYTVVSQAMQALFEGRLGVAEGQIEEALRLGQRAQSWNAEQTYWLQTWALRREQGRTEGLEEAVRRLIAVNPSVVLWRCVLAAICAQSGRLPEAGSQLDELSREGFEAIPRDEDHLLALTLLAEVCRQVEEPRQAKVLYELLEPYSSRIAVSPPNLSTGSIARSLGDLAAQMSRWEASEGHFREAIRANARMGARPWVARARCGYARMLLRRGGVGDPEEATELLAEVQARAGQLGLAAVLREASDLLATAQGASRRDSVSSPVEDAAGETPALAGPMFLREGEYWAIGYPGQLFRFRDAKGLRYIARLLGEPGREIHVIELVAGERSLAPGIAPGVVPEGTRIGGLGDAGPLLDADAKASYRRRLQDLEELIAEADEWNDRERAHQARAERELLTQELARAVGLGGRDRRAASASERARVNATRAIRAAIGKIQEHLPDLGEHLAASLRTGAFCCYAPADTQLRWRL